MNKDIDIFVGEKGINKKLFNGIISVLKIIESKNFIYKKAKKARVNDLEGIISHLKSNDPLEDIGIKLALEIVIKMREDFGQSSKFSLMFFKNILEKNQKYIFKNNFSFDKELNEVKEFLYKKQSLSPLNGIKLKDEEIEKIVKRMHPYNKEMHNFIFECAKNSYKGLQIVIEDDLLEQRSFEILKTYNFKARISNAELNEFFEKSCDILFVRNGIDNKLIFDILGCKREEKSLLVFYDKEIGEIDKNIKNLFSKNKKDNIYFFRMGENFFIDEVFNVISVLDSEDKKIFINKSDSLIYKFFIKDAQVSYDKQKLKLPIIFGEKLNKRVKILNERLDNKGKAQELMGQVFSIGLNKEDSFRFAGIREKIYEICLLFKNLSNKEIFFSEEIVIPQIYRFLEQKYNDTHSLGFYILKQGLYKTLKEINNEENLYLILENKEELSGYKDGKFLNFFDELLILPLEYYTKSLEAINSTLKQLAKVKYIVY